MSAYLEYQGNVVLSVSGGRTSGEMLRGAIKAHNGVLPDNWRVTFANTGRERPETLAFVEQMGVEWNVAIQWLEWRPKVGEVAFRPELEAWIAENAPHWLIDDSGFEVVTPATASRNGEPFEALIMTKAFLPNAVMRFCTEYLKVKSIKAFLLASGWDQWTNLVGLRHDEGHRILTRIGKEEAARWKEPYRSAFPLDRDKVAKVDVAERWAAESFDLGIASNDGNCDGCFLLSMKKLMWRERQRPGTLDWWGRVEQGAGGRFVTEYSYADLKRWIDDQPMLFDVEIDDGSDSECGDLCPGTSDAEISALKHYYARNYGDAA